MKISNFKIGTFSGWWGFSGSGGNFESLPPGNFESLPHGNFFLSFYTTKFIIFKIKNNSALFISSPFQKGNFDAIFHSYSAVKKFKLKHYIQGRIKLFFLQRGAKKSFCAFLGPPWLPSAPSDFACIYLWLIFHIFIQNQLILLKLNKIKVHTYTQIHTDKTTMYI